jgi:hypothetical protein
VLGIDEQLAPVRTFRRPDLGHQRPDVLDGQEINQALPPDQRVLIYKAMYPSLSECGHWRRPTRHAASVPVVPQILSCCHPHVSDQKGLIGIWESLLWLERLKRGLHFLCLARLARLARRLWRRCRCCGLVRHGYLTLPQAVKMSAAFASDFLTASWT